MDKITELAKHIGELRKLIPNDPTLNRHAHPLMKEINAALESLDMLDHSKAISLKLWEVDFEERLIKLAVPDFLMKKGFCAGNVWCDLTDVQSGKRPDTSPDENEG